MTDEPGRSADPGLADISLLSCIFRDCGLPPAACTEFLINDDDSAVEAMSLADRIEALNLRHRIKTRIAAEVAAETPDETAAWVRTQLAELRRAAKLAAEARGSETAPKVPVYCHCCKRPTGTAPADSWSATRGTVCYGCYMEDELGTACPGSPPDSTPGGRKE